MKKLIAPVIVALLVVITLAVATQYFVLPALIDYLKGKARDLGRRMHNQCTTVDAQDDPWRAV